MAIENLGDLKAAISERLDYDRGTGEFRWKELPIGPSSTRHDKAWNTRFAGKLAGSIDSHGHVQIKISGRLYLAHRLAWLIVYGEFPNGDLDHRDCDKENNSIGNLRVVTRSQNAMNIPTRKNNKSGVRGVCWDRKTRKWMAQLRVNGQHKMRGFFPTLDEAKKAYAEAAQLHVPDFKIREYA